MTVSKDGYGSGEHDYNVGCTWTAIPRGYIALGTGCVWWWPVAEGCAAALCPWVVEGCSVQAVGGEALGCVTAPWLPCCGIYLSMLLAEEGLT